MSFHWNIFGSLTVKHNRRFGINSCLVISPTGQVFYKKGPSLFLLVPWQDWLAMNGALGGLNVTNCLGRQVWLWESVLLARRLINRPEGVLPQLRIRVLGLPIGNWLVYKKSCLFMQHIPLWHPPGSCPPGSWRTCGCSRDRGCPWGSTWRTRWRDPRWSPPSWPSCRSVTPELSREGLGPIVQSFLEEEVNQCNVMMTWFWVHY